MLSINIKVTQISKLDYHKTFKKLKFRNKQNAGRSNTGNIVTRHKSSPLNRSLFINYTKSKIASIYTEFLVIKLIYDSQRSAYLALIMDTMGLCQYILAPSDIKVGSKLYFSNSIFSKSMSLAPGTNSTLANIPTGSQIYNIESLPGRGGKYVRSAGCFAKLMIKKKLFSKKYAGIQLPSKKLIYLPLNCYAFLGQVSNKGSKLKNLKKAGINRNLGVRPCVRGVAMNPIDHPHGGGEGKSSTGALPKTPWGKPAKWKKTISKYKKKSQQKFITKIHTLSSSLKVKF